MCTSGGNLELKAATYSYGKMLPCTRVGMTLQVFNAEAEVAGVMRVAHVEG